MLETTKLSVRGHTAYYAPAPLGLRTLSVIVDLAVLVFLTFIAFWAFQTKPLFLPAALAAGLGLFVGLRFTLQRFFKASLGQMVWRLTRPSLRGTVFQREVFCFNTWMGAIFLTLLVTIATGFVSYRILASSPYFLSAKIVTLNPHVPGKDANWSVLPLYYTMGAWPVEFSGKPILYSLPYEKGPPDRFIGHIIAQWENPQIRVTAKGPITPITNLTASKIRSCLGSLKGLGSWSCLKIRQHTLEDHWTELARRTPMAWSIQWFEVDNPELPLDERPRGIHLSVFGKNSVQERFVFITPFGTQQTFILERPKNASGEQARELFIKALGSQRVFGELAQGKAWVDQELAKVKIIQNKTTPKEAAFISQVAKIHSLLLSKISMDPKTLESYYHLGGTASLLARYALTHKDPELSAIAKPMIQSAFRYAKDLAPTDSRTTELENMLLTFSE